MAQEGQREQYDEGICTLPPEGWWCSRTPGHEGPCAARPLEEADDDTPLSDADLAMIDAAWEKHKAAAPEWSDGEIEGLLTDAIGDSFDMDWDARDGAKAIMRELAECGLHITRTPERQALQSGLNPDLGVARQSGEF